MTSAAASPRRIAATAAMSVPSSMRPVTSSATETCSGTRRPASLEGAAGRRCTAARVSRMSCIVSICSRSTPPSSSAGGLLAEEVDELAGSVIAESVGSLPDGSIPVGPIEPATKRGQSAVANSSHASRAMRAAATVLLERRLVQPPLLEPDAGRLERVRDQVVGAGVEVRAVDVADELGRRTATGGRRCPRGRRSRPPSAWPSCTMRAHRAVLDDRALAQRERGSGRRVESHRARTSGE